MAKSKCSICCKEFKSKIELVIHNFSIHHKNKLVCHALDKEVFWHCIQNQFMKEWDPLNVMFAAKLLWCESYEEKKPFKYDILNQYVCSMRGNEGKKLFKCDIYR